MASLYGGKLGNMSHVVSLLASTVPGTFLEHMSEEDSTIGAVLYALRDAHAAFVSFEYTDEQKAELAELEKKHADMQAQDISAIVLAEVFKAQKTPLRALEIMQSLPARQAKHAASVAEVQTQIDVLTQAAQAAAEAAFSAGMQSSSKSAGDGNRAVWDKIDPINKRCTCKHGKHKHNILVTGDTSYTLYQTVGETPYCQVTHNNKDNPLPEGFTLKAASSVRRLSDCIQAGLPLTVANLKSFSNGIGKRIDNDSGSLLSAHDDLTTWQAAADTRFKNWQDAQEKEVKSDK